MKKYKLNLFVTGNTVRSERAITNLRRICQKEMADQCEFSIIDVLEQPHLAEKNRILATPTLIREVPTPVKRVIGDLSDTENVLLGLDLQPIRESNQEEGE